MSILPALKPKQVISALEKAGFKFARQKGSHKIYKKDNTLLTIPFHNKDLKRGTLVHIIKQAGLSIEEFIDLLRK
ncbi:type II toxin-antitoxin system HicA family toxin [Patescibacteria group bacterium]|nr:type II toxin-antitoxin system HicA family toxin [Patescibacteria group bacterium]